MPMFDDPKKELQRLQQELLAAEEEEYGQIPDEMDKLTEDCDRVTDEDYSDLFQEEPQTFYRNYSNGYGRDVRNFANNYGVGHSGALLRESEEYDNEGSDELDGTAIYMDDIRERPRKKKKKGSILWTLIAIAEVGILIALVRWCMEWFL